jgi:hypothetical protein
MRSDSMDIFPCHDMFNPKKIKSCKSNQVYREKNPKKLNPQKFLSNSMESLFDLHDSKNAGI